MVNVYPPPPGEVIRRLDVRIAGYLGGRANRHWLVTLGGRPLVLRGYQARPMGDIDYELRVLERLDALGWPTPVAVKDPIEVSGRTWCLFRWLPGAPRVVTDIQAEQRDRGRLLAELHCDLEALVGLGQRSGCGRADEIVTDTELTIRLRDYERLFPQEARIMRWHVDRAQECFGQLGLQSCQLIVLHGDFTDRNVFYEDNALTGVIDFEATHLNYRASEFALAWRGKHDAVIRGYEEVRPLDDVDRSLLAPALWSWVFLGVADEIWQMTTGVIEPHRFEWQVDMLLRRSPLMGEQSMPYPGLRRASDRSAAQPKQGTCPAADEADPMSI